MNALRKTLAWFFAVTALAFACIMIAQFHEAVRALHSYARATATYPVWLIPYARRNLIIAVLTDIAIPAFLIALFTAAAWTAYAGKRSVRYWGSAASLIYLLLGVPLLIWLHGIENPAWVLLALGIAGIVAFICYQPVEKTFQTHNDHMPGDGTHSLIDKFLRIAPEIAALGIVIWLMTWGHSRGIAENTGAFIFLEAYLIAMLTLVIHEGGHAIAGKLLKMKLLSFVVGPFQWIQRYGKWRFKFRPTSLVGWVHCVPVSLENFRKREIIHLAAGPFANLLTCVIAAVALFAAPGHPWKRFWDPLAIFVTISLVGFVYSLIPHRGKIGYSDGAQIYQLLSGDLWVDYHRAIAQVYSTLVSPLRPDHFDIETMQRAAGTITRGQDELLLHLYIYGCHLQRGEFAAASNALFDAERVYDSQKVDLDVDAHGPFVFGNALLRRDPAATRLWWNRMDAKSSEPIYGGRWINYSAFLWMEGRLPEAREALERAHSWAQQLPHFGAWDAERNAIALFRKALDEENQQQVPAKELSVSSGPVQTS